MKPVYSALVTVIVYGVLLLGLAHLIYLDSFNFTDTKLYGENSYTEWTQVIVLGTVIILMLIASRISPERKLISVLVGGFFGMAFIREFDATLDSVFDGLWQILAFSVLGLTGFLTWKLRSEFKESLNDFISSAPFGFITSGFLVTFTFSRLYGEARTWEQIMQESYMRAVKNISEESIELLGYTIVLFGTVEWIRYLIANKNKSL